MERRKRFEESRRILGAFTVRQSYVRINGQVFYKTFFAVKGKNDHVTDRTGKQLYEYVRSVEEHFAEAAIN
jgi:hypothetical protein